MCFPKHTCKLSQRLPGSKKQTGRRHWLNEPGRGRFPALLWNVAFVFSFLVPHSFIQRLFSSCFLRTGIFDWGYMRRVGCPSHKQEIHLPHKDNRFEIIWKRLNCWETVTLIKAWLGSCVYVCVWMLVYWLASYNRKYI